MEVRLFGELEALDGGVPVPVRGAKQRALLALLALQRGQPVSADRLIDLLWGDRQAANPANALQTQIGQLRRTLGPTAILTSEAGYALTGPSSPCTGADARPRPCAPTPKSVITWRASSASTPARRCGNSRPASWPRTRRSPQPAAQPARLRLRWSRRRRRLATWEILWGRPPARDEVVCPAVAARSCAASAAGRAAGPRDRVEADARLRTRWLRQDDAAHRVAGGGPGRAGRRAACLLAVARPGRQRSRVLLDLCDRRAADGGIRGRRECAGPPAGAPAAPDRNGAHRAAQ